MKDDLNESEDLDEFFLGRKGDSKDERIGNYTYNWISEV